MTCPKSGKKRKRLPSINPFFHYLKCIWKQFRSCKRSAVVEHAVRQWKNMSKSQKQPFYDQACRAQKLHRRAKKCRKPKPKCPKPKPRCPKPKTRCPRPKPKCQKPKPSPCPPCPKPQPPSPCKKKKPC